MEMTNNPDASSYMRISPRDFIRPPFVECPKCRAEAFGILHIVSDRYFRRCKLCLYPQGKEKRASYKLPPLSKTLVYLDQFVLSNMVKVLSPSHKSQKPGEPRYDFKSLFEKLDVLTKKQLIICPSSSFHEEESSLSSFYTELRKMFRHLDCGVTLHSFETILQIQVMVAARAWLAGEEVAWDNLEPKDVTDGKINAWLDTFIIDVNMMQLPDLLTSMRNSRERVAKGIEDVFPKWRTDTTITFESQLEGGILVHARHIDNAPLNRLQEYVAVRARVEESGAMSLDDAGAMIPDAYYLLWDSLCRLFDPEEGPNGERVASDIAGFLKSKIFATIPTLLITSALWARIAYKAAHEGMVNPPNRGTNIDFKMLGVTLLYCDAVFIDRKCHSYLLEKQVRDALDYKALVFSVRNLDEFLEYLEGIERKASGDHLAALHEVYGPDYSVPFTGMYEDEE